MDEAEKQRYRNYVAERHEGYGAVERERMQALRDLDHRVVVSQLLELMNEALELPVRESSWLVDYNQKVQKVFG